MSTPGVWKQDWKQVSDEVERRHEVVETLIKKNVKRTEPLAEEQQQAVPIPDWQDDQQQQLVVHITGRQQKPRADKAGVQLLASFRTPEQAAKYGQDLYATMPECHVWQVQVGQWFLLCKSIDRQRNNAYVMRKIDQLKQLHNKHKQFRQQDFQQNRDQKQKGPLAQSLDQQKMLKRNQRKRRVTRASSRLAALKLKTSGGISAIPETPEVVTPAVPPKTGYVGQVPTSFMVRKQNYAVVSWMKDITPEVMRGSDDMEPACIVWRSFDDYPTAKKWLEEVMCKLVRDFDLEIVDLYEWLYPEHVDREKMQEGFRNKQQEQFMLRRKTDKAEVKDFQHWCEEKKVDTPVIDLDATTPEPVAGQVPAEALTWQDRAPVPSAEVSAAIKVPAPVFTVGKVAVSSSATNKTHDQALPVPADIQHDVTAMLHTKVQVQPAPQRQPLPPSEP